VNRKSSDFMIATEGEMKKVSWSSRREVIGSTKVVILFTIALACFLFVVDLAFQTLFSAIGVLKT
jgi:preprotein translocase subunit SecE